MDLVVRVHAHEDGSTEAQVPRTLLESKVRD